jgi:CHAD domain-containing protein
MAYHLRAKESVAAGIQRICREQMDKAFAEMNDRSLDRPEVIHEVRKRCKRIRGALRLVRPRFDHYPEENAWFRDAARELAATRDAQVLLQCYDQLMDTLGEQAKPSAFASIRRELMSGCQRHLQQANGISDRLDKFASRIRQARDRIGFWKIPGKGISAVKRGWRKTYRRGRKAMEAAYDEPSPENFHEWRKRVKYQRYQTRLLRRLWPPVMKAHWSEVKRLSDLLGDDHDLAVLKRTVAQTPAEFGRKSDVQAFLQLVDRRRKELQAEARPLGQRVYAEKPKHIVRRFLAYWQAQRNDIRSRSAKSGRKGKLT